MLRPCAWGSLSPHRGQNPTNAAAGTRTFDGKDVAAAGWVAFCTMVLLVTVFNIVPDPGVETPPPPDYTSDGAWAALPTMGNGADIIPAGCGTDLQASAQVDVFFVHPTSFLMSGGASNGPVMGQGFLTSLVTESQLFQQANAFNGVAAVYAPRYRQASQSVQDLGPTYNWRPSGENETVDAAMQLALSDVEAAFDEFLERCARLHLRDDLWV